jgi:hypothetical protein
LGSLNRIHGTPQPRHVSAVFAGESEYREGEVDDKHTRKDSAEGFQHCSPFSADSSTKTPSHLKRLQAGFAKDEVSSHASFDPAAASVVTHTPA